LSTAATSAAPLRFRSSRAASLYHAACGVTIVSSRPTSGSSSGGSSASEHVEAGALDRSGLQRVEQRVGVDDRPAAHVDDHRALAEPIERVGVDHPAGRVRQGA